MSRAGRGWPLAVQLALAFALVTAVALGGGGALLLREVQERQLADRSSRLLAQANAAANLVTEMEAGPEQDLTLALYRFQQTTGVRAVVTDAQGIALADSWDPSPVVGKPLTHPEVALALRGGESTGPRLLEPGTWVLYGAVPLWQEKQVAGAVLVSADISSIAAVLADLRRQLLLVAAFAEALALLAGVLLARYLARPLQRLQAGAGRVAAGNLSERVVPGGSREMVELGQSFNRMASELGRLDQQRRAFVADASHELRTPVASIRALAEGLLSGTPPELAHHREYLADIVHECERSAHLVDRLLELARLDARREAQQDARCDVARPNPRGEAGSPVDVAAVATAVVRELTPLAKERSVELVLSAPLAAVAPVEQRLVETVLGNLIENGLKYTPAGGRVEVTVTAGTVAVRDTGPGIAAEHLPHIFDRFYRIDKARSRASGGAGLGLAIAAEAAALLGGRIEVDSHPGEGSCFTLILPM